MCKVCIDVCRNTDVAINFLPNVMSIYIYIYIYIYIHVSKCKQQSKIEEDIGMACHIVYKQVRDDTQKVNTESPVPTSFLR